MTDPSLERIGRYEIVRTLGEGAMGRVLLGRDPSLDRLVAIKTVRVEGLPAARIEAYLARFQNEAKAAARLKHPNVVQVYDVGEDTEAGPYLVFEYVQGQPLGDRLEPGGIRSLAAVVEIVDGIAAALDAAHAAGICHRDVKPDNVLVAEDGSVKLADFGIARLPEAAMTQAGQFLGTPSYAAPEALARGDCTPMTDLFSLAAVAFTTLTGERPFPGEGIAEVSHRIIHEQPRSAVSLRSDLPEAVGAVLEKGLSKDPEGRFGTCGEFAAALRAAALGERAAPAGAGDSSRRLQAVFLTVALGLVAAGWIALTYTIGKSAGNGATEEEPDAGADDRSGDRVVAPVIRPIVPPSHEIRPRVRELDRRSDAAPEQEVDGSVAAPDAAPSTAQPESDASPKESDELIKDLLDEARRLQASGNSSAARRRLEEVLRLAPAHPEARMLLDSLPPPPEPQGAPAATSSPDAPAPGGR